MSQILFIDTKQRMTEFLQELERNHHSVVCCTSYDFALHTLRSARTVYDIVIINISSNSPEDWRALERVYQILRTDAVAPMVLCVADAYRGPQLELAVERKGARLAYVR